ncbi:MAG: hypothetical protein PVSMB3_02210 [Candidatus Dormibacteraceae bacterium]
MRDTLGRHCGERVPARRAASGHVRAAMAAEVSRRHGHPAMRAGDERRSVELTIEFAFQFPFRFAFLGHPPPPFM